MIWRHSARRTKRHRDIRVLMVKPVTMSIILEPQEEWESLAIVPSSIEMTDDGYVLLYSGTDGRTWNTEEQPAAMENFGNAI